MNCPRCGEWLPTDVIHIAENSGNCIVVEAEEMKMRGRLRSN